MNPFLLAHGYDPGPTQRPTLAGSLTGLVATVPALPLLHQSGALEAQSQILGLSIAGTLGAGALAMAAAGGIYGRMFGRAANDPRGGWLFGMAFGFLLWAAGAVMLLPILSGGKTPAGTTAIGIALSLLCWGTALGSVFPHVHRRVRTRTWVGALPKDKLGPAAAAARTNGPRRR